MRQLLIVLAVLVVVGIEVVVLCRIAPDKSTRSIPMIDGEILAAESSPDYTRIALFVRKEDRDTYASSDLADTIMLYDVKKRKIISTYVNIFVYPSYNEKYTWSSDSRYFVLINDGHGLSGHSDIVVVSKDGSKSTTQLDNYANSLAWHPSGWLLYSCSNIDAIFRYNIDAKRTQKVTSAYLRPNIYTVNGSVYVSYFKGKDKGHKNQDAIYVTDLDTSKEIYHVPLYRTSEWDNPQLTISPDGRMFFLTASYSASARNVVAKISDIGSVFKYPNIAVFWQDTIEDRYRITWLPEEMNSHTYENQMVLVKSYYSCFWFNSITGSREEFGHRESDVKFVNWWNPKKAAGKVSRKDPWCLVVTNRGLELCTGADSFLQPVEVLLDHRVYKQ
ncbi:MAG: TolB family protein [Armatimonadota bacterium]